MSVSPEAASPSSAPRVSPLRSQRVRRIIVAYTVNRLGTWFGLLALVVAVFDHTHSALAVAALLFAGQALPAFVVPAVVARVEASTRRGGLSRLYFLEAVLTGVLVVLVSHFWLPAVLLVVMFDGTAALAAIALLRTEVAKAGREALVAARARDFDERRHETRFAAPSRRSSDSSVEEGEVTEEQEAERRANAALNVAFSGTFVAGPVIGGLVVAAWGAPAALLIDVGSFLIGGALLPDLRAHVEEAAGDSVRARLHAAWQHINQSWALRRLLLVEAAALSFVQAGGPIEVSLVKATLRGGDRGLGLVLTSWGAGAVLGSIGFARLERRSLAATLGAGTLVIGVAYLGLAAAPSLALACMAGLLGGVGNAFMWPSLFSLVQRLTPSALHGRLMGAVESLGALCLAVGLPVGGVLVALSSPRVAFVVVGIGVLAPAVALLSLSRRLREPRFSTSVDAAPVAGVEPNAAAGLLAPAGGERELRAGEASRSG